jgi:hypothetical protein
VTFRTRLFALASVLLFASQTPAGQAPVADTIDPQVGIVSPATDATISGTVAVQVQASDASGVGGVWLEVDGLVVGLEDTAAPWEFSWDSSTHSSGAHILTVIARDTVGNAVRSAVVPVFVDGVTEPPPPPPVNRMPTAMPDALLSDGGVPVVFAAAALLANDSDPDGDAIALANIAGASSNGGQIAGNANGTWTYTPPAGFVGTDAFTYTIVDGAGGSDSATVQVSVTPRMARVPNVVGKTLEEGRSLVLAVGLTVAPVVYQVNAAAAGTIIAQSPAGDANVALPHAVTLTVSSGPPSPQTPAGLVLSLNFDSVVNGRVTDASGYDNHGVVRGAQAAVGRFGGALRFDGVDDWVTVADADSLDLTSDLTVEAWVRPTVGGGWRTVLMKEAPGNAAYYLYSNNANNRPAGYYHSGANVLTVAGPAVVPTHEWTHLAMTYNGTTMNLYVNGVLARSAARTGLVNVTKGGLRIGGNASWPNEFFAGVIDEVRVYNRALAVEEIAADMNTADGPPPPAAPPIGADGLVLALGFDEPLGATAVTDSAGHREGSVHGAEVMGGRYGNALSFDGVDDIVSIPGDASLAASTAVTMEAWVMPTYVQGWHTVLIMENVSGGSYYLYANNPNVSRPSGYYESGVNARSINGTKMLAANTWTHLAVTYDGAAMKIYVNGTLVRTAARAGKMNNAVGPFRVGGNTMWPNEFFAGLIDEVRVYNRALSAEEILQDMSTPVNPPTP